MGQQRAQRRATVMRSRGAHSGFKFRRKVCTVKDVVSGVRPPETGAAVTQKNPQEVSVLLKKQML